MTTYSHMSSIVAQPGLPVRQGQVIGYVGSSGLSTGPHVHFEVRIGGRPVNPLTARLVSRPVFEGPQLAAFKVPDEGNPRDPDEAASTCNDTRRRLKQTICSLPERMKVGGVALNMADPATKAKPRRNGGAQSAPHCALMRRFREPGRSRVGVRLIDISTRGCRIEATCTLSPDTWLLLSIGGLETQYCRVVWHCHEFAGLEFGSRACRAGARTPAARA